jgi:xanthine dehydrogenase YagT iron-sulfur-binding subunit
MARRAVMPRICPPEPVGKPDDSGSRCRGQRRVPDRRTDPVLTELSLTVNGERRRVAIDTRTSLLDLLRETFGLTGTKNGCSHGQCGACTVLLDGRRVNACLVLAVTARDAEVRTVEGLAADGELHPLQRAFIEHDAFQCGYCTPGQLCSAAGMLDEVARGWPSAVTGDAAPTLTPDEVRERMSGNLCRCGAYLNLVPAIVEAGR